MRRPPVALLAVLAVLALGPVAVAITGRSPGGPAPPATGPGSPSKGAPARPPTWPAPVPAGGGYFPLDPVTVAETTRLPPGGGVTLALTGAGGVPPGGALAVALSLSAAPTASGRLALAGGDRPPTADDPGVALGAGTPAAAFLVVAVPSDGRVRLANLAPGATTVGVAVAGYYAAPCGGGGAGYVPADPDRPAPPAAALAPGQAAAFQVDDPAGSPPGQPGRPVAVALQVRAAEDPAAGFLRVGPDGPGAAAEPAAGFRVVRLGPSGRVRVVNAGSGRAVVAVRVRGWYRPGAGSSYRTAGPEPLLDVTVPAGATAGFEAVGRAGVPAGGVGAVALEVRAEGSEAGRLELGGGATVPLAAGRVTGGFDLAAPGPGGRLTVRNASAGPARVTVRARGYQGAPAPLAAVADPATLAVFEPRPAARPGWTGGDGNVPVRLPDGRTAWLFGDSFHGTVRPDGSRGPSSRLVRNALVVQDGHRLETRVGPPDPASGHPTALLAPPPGEPRAAAGQEPGTWLWPGGGLVDGGALQVFGQEFRRPAGAGDPAAFEWTGRNLLATLSLPDLVPREVTPLYGGAPGPGGVGWGSAVLQEADFTYLYGVEDTGPPLHVKHVHLARFPRGGARGFWSFWDGAGWSPDPSRSARLAGQAGAGRGLEQLTGIASSVVRAGASYLLLSIPDGGHEILARLGCSPAGPWGPPRLLHRTREHDLAYLARAYPDGPGLLLAYSRAPRDPHRLFASAAAYLPGFVRVR